MMRILATAAAAALLLGASQASASAGDPAATPAPAAPPPTATPAATSRFDPNQVICKHQDQTGSRLGGGKICHTRQEWADIAAQYRTITSDIQQRTSLGSPPH
jgi:hypothetical protein